MGNVSINTALTDVDAFIRVITVPDGTSANSCIGEGSGVTTIYRCLASYGSETAGFTDVPNDITKQGIIIAYNFMTITGGDATSMYVKQVLISPHAKTYYRYIQDTTVGDWVSDTNAETLNGYAVNAPGALELVGNPTASGARPVFGGFDDSSGSDVFLDIRTTDGSITRMQLGTDTGFPRFFKRDASTSAWTENFILRSMSSNHRTLNELSPGTDVLEFAGSDACPLNASTLVRILNSPACPTNYGYPADNSDFIYDIHKIPDTQWITIKAYDVRTNEEFINSRTNGNWSGWRKRNDGGNATTLSGKQYNQFVNYLGHASDTNMLNNPAYVGSPYECIIKADTGSSIGLPNTTWWHLKYFMHANSDGYGCQVAFPLNNTTEQPRYRTSLGTTWGNWTKFADGGNASSVGGVGLTNAYGSAGLVYINNDYGGIEIGNHIDFHSGVATKDFDIRIYTNAVESNEKLCIVNSSNNKATVYANLEGHAEYLSTLNHDGTSFGDTWLMKAQWNKTGDGTFRIYCGDASVWTSVNRAEEATYANTTGIVTTPSNSCLRNLSSGSAVPQTTDSSAAGYVPNGAWYGQYAEV